MRSKIESGAGHRQRDEDLNRQRLPARWHLPSAMSVSPVSALYMFLRVSLRPPRFLAATPSSCPALRTLACEVWRRRLRPDRDERREPIVRSEPAPSSSSELSSSSSPSSSVPDRLPSSERGGGVGRLLRRRKQ
jgi:hypothetical protein